MRQRLAPRPYLAAVCLFACSCAVSVATPIPADFIQWRVEDGGNGHWYKLVHRLEYNSETGRPTGFVPISWEDARLAAEQLGGHLATITSASENAFLASLFDVFPIDTLTPAQTRSFAEPWIGGYQAADASQPDAGWMWVTGEPFSYTNWATYHSQPDNGGDDPPPWRTSERFMNVWFNSGFDNPFVWYDQVGTVTPDSFSRVAAFFVETSIPEPGAAALLLPVFASFLLAGRER